MSADEARRRPGGFGWRPTLRLRAVVLVTAVAVGLTACAGSPTATEDATSSRLETAGIDLGDYSNVVARLDFDTGTVTLPIDAISRKSAQIVALRREARQALVDSCLRERRLPGLDWPEVRPPDENRLFGLWSVPLAGRYGLEMPSTVGPSLQLAQTQEQAECLGFAKGELSSLDAASDTVSLDTLIDYTAYYAVVESAEGRAAITSAQECMTDRGLSLDAESGFPRADATAANSEANIRIATNWATCNVETGAVQTLFDLLARYQTALINENEAAGVELATQKQDLIDGLEEIVAAYG